MAEERILNVLGVDYIISSDGHIFSTKNVGRAKYHKEISQRRNTDGYMDVTLGHNTFRTTRKVHRLVAEAFLPNPCNLPEVDHIDNVRDNNDVSNLQWISRNDNIAKIPFEHASAGRSGEGNGRSTVTKSDVLHIREKYEKDNCKISQLSKLYDMPYSTVFNIVHNNTWNNIK